MGIMRMLLLAVETFDKEHDIPLQVRLEGIQNTAWQGRMETVMPGVVLDGAHNAAGVQEFVKTVQRLQENRRVVILISAVAEKNYEKMIETI